MPKTFDRWLLASAHRWQLPGVAQNHHGIWHKGEPDTFAPCGRWLGAGFIRSSAGKGQKRRNPWDRRVNPLRLCPVCFAEEMPLVNALHEADTRLGVLSDNE